MKNMIKALVNSLGTLTEDPEELKRMVNGFYKNLYTSEGTADMEQVLSKVPVEVTPQMNAMLLAPYTSDEVKTALFQMFPTKDPVPDGYAAHLYQRRWDICGDEVTIAVLRIIRGYEGADCVNNTVLVLIPKALSDPIFPIPFHQFV